MWLKVFIPTWWKWVDLGDITKYINKSLVKVWRKPAISYIIDSYPDDTEFIITTWYLWKQVKDFLAITYPQKNVKLIDVDVYEWEKASLVYSMLQAKEYLQSPFIYQACDTIVLDNINYDSFNRIAWYKDKSSTNYAWFNVLWDSVDKIYEKWAMNTDFAYVWLAHIEDYKKFWECAESVYKNSNNNSISDVNVIESMINYWIWFKYKEVKQWFDTWNVEWLNIARNEIPDSFHILDKLEESIYIYDDFVVKFFYNQELSDKRVKRAEFLKWLVPEIESHKDNFFRYKFTEWKLFSRVANTQNFKEFLSWTTNNLWTETHEVSDEEFKKVCYKFYYTKSMERINKLMTKYSIKDWETIINDVKVPSIQDLFSKIDWDRLCNSKQTNFHWDFILDNIIKKDDGFCLLDWRQDFWWLLQSWDMYYDLAKLNHNLTINHDIVNANLLKVDQKWDNIYVDIHRRETLVECQDILHKFINEQWFDLKKVKTLSAIIWLNMSPLHHHPFDKFLFYFGKYKLWQAINSNN